MAQSIALLIHKQRYKQRQLQQQPSDVADDNNKETCNTPQRYSFVCHESSHLLLHEQEGYRELLGLEPVSVSTRKRAKGISIPCLTLADVQNTLHNNKEQQAENGHDHAQAKLSLIALMLELPHRELGGKINTWDELVALKEYCRDQGMAFHCDGARIFEATTGFYGDNDNHKSLSDLAGLFDSVYVSCYKGLGGLSGAFLLGDKDFCHQARTWLRRFGGNLYTLLPYAVAAHRGYEREWKGHSLLPNNNNNNANKMLSFREKKKRLKQWVKQLSNDSSISKWLSFDPATPQTPMVHGYLRNCSLEQCNNALAKTKERTNIEIVRYFKPVTQNPSASTQNYNVMFEWSVGQANGAIHDEVVVKGWQEFCRQLSQEVGE